jgi:glycosyltransferase involved in cell wall biosynthesis
MSRFPRLRLAMFSYRLPVCGQQRGGIERAAHTLADGLARRGHGVVVFSHDPRPEGACYEVHDLPWKSFVDSWAGRRITMGYLGNILAVLPDYREFDAVIAHGDSLLAPLIGKPVLRVLHGSALGEARSATSFGRTALQLGVYIQELATAFLQRGVVAVSENARRDNPFVTRVIPHGVDESVFTPWPVSRSPEPSVLFVGALEGRKQAR